MAVIRKNKKCPECPGIMQTNYKFNFWVCSECGYEHLIAPKRDIEGAISSLLKVTESLITWVELTISEALLYGQIGYLKAELKNVQENWNNEWRA